MILAELVEKKLQPKLLANPDWTPQQRAVAKYKIKRNMQGYCVQCNSKPRWLNHNRCETCFEKERNRHELRWLKRKANKLLCQGCGRKKMDMDMRFAKCVNCRPRRNVINHRV